MCELCDVRAREAGIDAVADFKPPSPPAISAETSSSSTESGGSWATIDDSPAAKRIKIENTVPTLAEADDLFTLHPGSTHGDLPVLANLVEWAKNNGAILHENVEIYVSPSHEVKLRVKPVVKDEAIKKAVEPSGGTTECSRAKAITGKINALHSLPANTHIISSPYAISLSYLNVLDAFPTFAARNGVARNFSQRWIDSVSPRTVGVFFLMQQYLLGDASFWAPYIKSLPQPRFEHLSLRALPSYAQFGPFPLRWDIQAAAKRSVCFDMKRHECECYDPSTGSTACQNAKRMPVNPYTPLKENEGRTDFDFVCGGWGSSVLDWSEKCEEEMCDFAFMHEESPDNSEDEVDVEEYLEVIAQTEPMYAIHWDREVMGPLFEWAQAIFWSRSFPSSMIPETAYGGMLDKLVKEEKDDEGDGEKGKTITWRQKLEKASPFPVLFPLLDMVNHAPGAKIDTLISPASDLPRTQEINSNTIHRRFVQIGPNAVLSLGLVNEMDIPASGDVSFDYKPWTLEEMLLGFGYERWKRKLADDIRMEVVTGGAV